MRAGSRTVTYWGRTPAALILAILIATACDGMDAAGTDRFGAITVERTGARVEVTGRRQAATTLTISFTLADARLLIAFADFTRGTRMSMSVESVGATILKPAGTANSAAAELSAEGGVEAGALRWRARFGSQEYDALEPSSRNQLARALAATDLGAALLDLLRMRTKVRARMAEARSAMELAALAVPIDAAGEDLPAELRGADDLQPPGMLTGDTPALGMTCATSIKCPGSAPYCVTPSHAVPFGVCNRSCLDADDCTAPRAVGRCSVDVGDVPGLSGSLRMCDLRCGAQQTCPYLLTCDAGSCQARQR